MSPSFRLWSLSDTIRWLPNDALLSHPIAVVTDAPTQSCAIVAGEDFWPVPFGAPDNLAAGGGFVFASYSERALIFTRAGSKPDWCATRSAASPRRVRRGAGCWTPRRAASTEAGSWCARRTGWR